MNITMGRHTFAFSSVLPVDKVEIFFERFHNLVELERLVNKREHAVQYLDCYVEQECDDANYPKLRNVVGMIQFVSKHECTDVKQWLLSGFGKTLCLRLFVVPLLNINKFRGFVKEKETGVCRAWTLGKFKNNEQF